MLGNVHILNVRSLVPATSRRLFCSGHAGVFGRLNAPWCNNLRDNPQFWS